jgi:GGDEF domain-containing protein
MPTEPIIELSCLVLSNEVAHEETLREVIGKHFCVKNLEHTDSQTELREYLRTSLFDLVVVALSNTSEQLPACLLRYPDMPVLVTMPSRKIGSIDSWLAQGANDIVSIQRTDRLRHTLNRLLNECATKVKLRRANSRLSTQYKLHQILLNTYAEAVMLRQNGRVIESNECFDTLINCKVHDNQARTIEWKRWVSVQSYKELHDSELLEISETTLSCVTNEHYRARIESIILEGSPAQLIRINPSPIGLNSLPDLETDSVTGLLVRASFTQRLQSLLQSSGSKKRYTAILISLPTPENPSHFSGVDRTVQDLLIYRAANTIEQHFKGNTLLGRTGINTLLLATPTSGGQSRKLALRVKAAIGRLGGLIDDPASIYIKTLTLAPNTLSAIEVMERLERPMKASGKPHGPTTNQSTSIHLSLGA